MKIATKISKTSLRGSVISEFLLVFPAFLVICMFVVETGLIWTDKHIMRLAAFEAARIYASGVLPEWQPNGLPETNPCLAAEINRKARQAALRKIAIISPSIAYFKARLGSQFSSFDISPLTKLADNLPGPAKRIVLRWATAAASTGIQCDYDAVTGNIKVDLTYLRAPETPFAGEVFWAMHNLTGLNNTSGDPYFQLDNNFFGVASGPVSDLTAAAFKNKVVSALGTVNSLSMNLTDAANMLSGIPGMEGLMDLNTAMPLSVVNGVSSSLNTTVSATNSIPLKDESKKIGQILTSVLYVVPEALRRIPMKVSTNINRNFLTDRAQLSGLTMEEPAWNGRIEAIIELKGDYRTWAHSMSTNHQGMIGK